MLREAHENRVSPSRFMQLPWPEWGSTDMLLSLVRRRHEAMICPCGCGQWAPESHDALTDGEWEMAVDASDAAVVCYAKAAMDRFQKAQSDKKTATVVEPGVIPTVRRL